MEPDGWDEERGNRLRDEFFEDANLRSAYSFCHSMCGKNNLPTALCRSMLARADRKRIWCYVNIPLWLIPYVLLTLEDFTGQAQGTGNPYRFHFLFKKPRATTVSALWRRTKECTIHKVFADSGELMRGSENPDGVKRRKQNRYETSHPRPQDMSIPRSRPRILAMEKSQGLESSRGAGVLDHQPHRELWEPDALRVGMETGCHQGGRCLNRRRQIWRIPFFSLHLRPTARL